MKTRMKFDVDTTRTSRARAALATPVALSIVAFALAAAVVLAVLAANGAVRANITRAATVALIAAVCASAAVAVIVCMSVRMSAAARSTADSTTEARRGEARMMGIIRSSMEAIITIDEAQNIVIFNPTAERIFGVTAAQALGTPLSRFIPQRFREIHARHVAQFGVTGISERQMGRQPVLFGLRANGEEFPLEASISQIREDSGKLYTVMLRDVTERVKSENALTESREELRRLSANLQHVREEEKTRIARELHDDLGQQLTALKMDLSALEHRLTQGASAREPLDPAVAGQLRGMFRMIDSTVASLRRIAADLRPVMLDDLGIVPAIEWLANDFTDRYGIAVERNIAAGDAEFTKDAATALFRIVQEALTNVARHADATAVELALHATSEHYVLRIADNGRGAEYHANANAGGDKSFGLIGVRERAYMLGGAVQIDTAQGEGFALTITFPLQAVQQEHTHP
ncbi:PAS domain S-box protein [Paraburkholderia sp. LEh10]|nr:PAS domain S-box protein [Paraburkholderia sp. LEh10]